MQDREQRVWKWQRCAPPRRTLHDCGGYVCTSYSPDLSGHIRPDKPSDSNRIGCVSQRKGYLPDNTDSGNKGAPREQDGRLTKRYAWTCYFRRRYLVPINVFFHMSLRFFFGSHPVYVLCDATVRCLFVQRDRLASTKYAREFYPVRGDQNMIIMARIINGTAVLMCFTLKGVTRT